MHFYEFVNSHVIIVVSVGIVLEVYVAPQHAMKI
jgi:hypothetical protein